VESRSSSRINIQSCVGGWLLAATAPGFTMVPASPAVLWKMATPRR